MKCEYCNKEIEIVNGRNTTLCAHYLIGNFSIEFYDLYRSGNLLTYIKPLIVKRHNDIYYVTTHAISRIDANRVILVNNTIPTAIRKKKIIIKSGEKVEIKLYKTKYNSKY